MGEVLTTCGFCSCGCGAYVEAKNGHIAAVCPSTNHPVSTARLCIKGWNGIPAVLGADRLSTPLVRHGDSLEPSSWEEAISVTASALKRFSAESIGVIGSAKTTNEECYSLAKFARCIVGTPNVDGACRFYDASAVHGLLQTTGTAASQIDLNSLTKAGSMLIVGSNARDQLPHVGTRIEAAADAGCRIVAVDPRTSNLELHATLFLHPKPGTDLVWIHALIKTILSRKLYVDAAPELSGFEELLNSVADVSPGRLESESGVDMNRVLEAAELLAANPPMVVLFGLGALQQIHSTEIVKGLADIAVLLGGAVMPLRGQNNAQGACDLGLTHEFLPGYGRMSDTAAVDKWQRAWNCRLPSEPGMSAIDMIRGCQSGRIKGLLIFGENVALSAPNTEESLTALDKAEFLAVSDLYLTETARLADVVFPACSFLEKEGTFTSIERRVQRVRKVLDPLGKSKPDLEIIADLASALGTSMERSPEQVMSEIAANVPMYAGITYADLDSSFGRQWSAAADAATRFAPMSGDTGRAEDAEYPYLLIAGRINFHQQTGTMAGRFGILKREYPDTYAELNDDDAGNLNLRPGTPIRISSKSGSIVRRMLRSKSVPPGCVHVPHFFGGDSPNALAAYECDPVSGVPAYKACAVKIEAVK